MLVISGRKSPLSSYLPVPTYLTERSCRVLFPPWVAAWRCPKMSCPTTTASSTCGQWCSSSRRGSRSWRRPPRSTGTSWLSRWGLGNREPVPAGAGHGVTAGNTERVPVGAGHGVTAGNTERVPAGAGRGVSRRPGRLVSGHPTRAQQRSRQELSWFLTIP